jgi:hypothetical protein
VTVEAGPVGPVGPCGPELEVVTTVIAAVTFVVVTAGTTNEPIDSSDLVMISS